MEEKIQTIDKIDEISRKRTKFFTRNIDALRYCESLKRRGKLPYKYIIVTWDE